RLRESRSDSFLVSCSNYPYRMQYHPVHGRLISPTRNSRRRKTTFPGTPILAIHERCSSPASYSGLRCRSQKHPSHAVCCARRRKGRRCIPEVVKMWQLKIHFQVTC
ncbi:hypothetical protein T310_9462, partial [Rasamsonia emersonii CBS 393.64]